MNKSKKRGTFLATLFLKNRRGLSTIVVTLIVIVLSLVAVGVVWAVVSNLLKNSSSQVGELNTLMINLKITSAYEQAGDIHINLQRQVGKGDLIKVKFILSDGTNSETLTENSIIKELDPQNFILHPSSLLSTKIATVSVALIYKSSDGKDTIGSVTDTYNILSGTSQNTGGNNNLNGCSPNCANLKCGPDPLCGQSCGTCGGTDVCTNGVCVPLNCVPDSVSVTCGTLICGKKINNCGAEINCLPGCSSGKICSNGNCVSVTPVNIGLVEETWPGTSGMYFGSKDLPIDKDYYRNYIKFPGSLESRCLLIAVYRTPVEGYTKSHIGFNFQTLIKTGDSYQIFSTSEECQA